MKGITFWLLAISFTFVLGVAATLTYLKCFSPTVQISQPLYDISLPENDSAELPDLTFCELANNPEKYDGKTVRLSAKLIHGLEGSWFSDANCGIDNAAVVSSENKEVWLPITKAREKRYKLLPKDKKYLSNHVDLTVTGKFKNVIYNEGGLTAPFRFEISSVEKVSDY